MAADAVTAVVSGGYGWHRACGRGLRRSHGVRGLVRGYLRNPFPGDATKIFRLIASNFRHFWASQNERQFFGKSLHE